MPAPRFVCDAMLGSLARWMRLAGFDTSYLPDCADEVVAEQARFEGRWLLTRDRGLGSTAGPRVLLLRRAGLDGQVAELRERLALHSDPALFFTRCSECNGELTAITREAVATRVPPYVAAHAERFSACPGCGRVYWPGSHVARISHRLAELFLSPREA